MKNKATWLKSLSVVMAVLLAMTAAGFFFLSDEQDTTQSGTVSAASFTTVEQPQEKQKSGIIEESIPEEVLEEENLATASDTPTKMVVPDLSDESAVVNNNKQAPSDNLKTKTLADQKETPVVVQTSSAPVDHKAESKPVETVTEIPDVQPVATEIPAVEVEVPQHAAAPVSYNWGSSANYVFRMEVKVSNNGSETAKNVNVAVPLLENSSPYQTTSLRSVNFDLVSSSGRLSTFNLGDIAPGETKTIVADFDITVRSLSLNSSNETLDRARIIFEQYAGSGNCRDLALAFINKAREQGIIAREVIGFARTQRGAMTSGSLQGSRHSWAEINIEGLGWVPVDLTFQYFGAFPHTSHIVESYGDQSLKVTYTGGSLSASWSNAIM
ncbi:MAG: hypothetical protein FJ152_06255 [Firmicutes bacterium]|nr:hypothetical protein [Bacillota bacterium]